MPHDPNYDAALAAQLIERFQNVITTVNRVRAKHLNDARIESVLTQLEDAITRIEDGQGYTFAERDALDFHLLENTPLENDTSLVQEMYSLRNILEKRATGPNRIHLL